MSDDVSGEIRSVLTDVLDKGPEEIEASWPACAEAGLLGLAAPSEATAARASASPRSACSCARSAPAPATCRSARRWSAAC